MSSDLLDVARRIAAGARTGEQVEAYVARTRECDVKVHDGNVESLVVAERAGVGVRLVVDGRQGFAWVGSLEESVVDGALLDARDNAQFATADSFAGIASADDVAGPVAALDLWRADVGSTPTNDKVESALAAEAATLGADERVRAVESASYGDAATETAIATSTGVEASTSRTTCSVASFALAGDGTETRTGYGFSAGRSFAELDVDDAAGDAATRAVRLLGSTQPRSRRLPVVLDRLVARSLLAIVGAALGGEAIVKGRSMFVGRSGEQVAATRVTLVDDPVDPDAFFGASTHDAEGVPARRVDLIVDGVLDGVLHNLYTGRRSATGTTGSAVRGGYATTPGTGARALTLAPGARTADEILASAGEALYVQSVSGLHSGTNPISGDFSVGAEGLMVRGGALAEPVREVTIASTLPRMLHDVVEIGGDRVWLPGGAAGMTLLIDGMSVSGR